MLKVPVIIVFSFLLIYGAREVSAISEEMQELMDMLRSTCTAESGADASMVERALKGDFDESDAFKCYVKCVADQMSCISEDGVVDVDAVIELLPPEIRAKGEPAIRKCGPIMGANPCESAWLTNKCWQKEMGDGYFLP